MLVTKRDLKGQTKLLTVNWLVWTFHQVFSRKCLKAYLCQILRKCSWGKMLFERFWSVSLPTQNNQFWTILFARFFYISLRSKRFRLASEQRETEERDCRFWPREKWNESRTFTRTIFRAVFDSRSSSVLCSQTARERFLNLRSWRYCVLGERDLAAEPLYQSSALAAKPREIPKFKRLVHTPYFGSRLRRQNFNHTIPPVAQATLSTPATFTSNSFSLTSL